MFCLLDNKLSKIFRYYEAIYEKRSKTPKKNTESSAIGKACSRAAFPERCVSRKSNTGPKIQYTIARKKKNLILFIFIAYGIGFRILI